MIRRLLPFALFLALAAVSAHADESLPLSKMREWKIVVAADAIPSERYAANEFQALFKSATGMELALAESATGSAIHIGPGPGAPDAGDLGDEGFRARVSPDGLWINGGRPRGTLYGVYDFFERRLGVRYLTFDHTYFPPLNSGGSLPVGEFKFNPVFSFRWSYYGENSAHPEFAARLRNNTVTRDEKLGGITPQELIGHSFYHLVPVEKYGKEHPEYFAFIDGVRRLEGTGGGPELCVSNPKVIEIAAQTVIQDLDANPHRRNYSVSQNDNADYCRCPVCEEINQREGTPMGANLMFVNAVAERVEKKHPNVKIGTLAYWYSRKAPKTIRPRANVQIQLCSIEACTLHPLDDPKCEKNHAFAEDLAAWKAICNDIWIWNYNTNFAAYDLPFPNLRSIGRNVDYFAHNNVHGVFMQASGNGLSEEISDLRNYVMSRCLWAPGHDSWEFVREFCKLHYQESSEPILNYLLMLHGNAERAGVHPGCFPLPLEVGLTPEMTRMGRWYFDEALRLAETDAVRARVEKASICSLRALLATAPPLRYADGKARMDFSPSGEDIVDRYVKLCRKYGMKMASEMMPAEDYFKELDRLKAGIPALRIENDNWRITVLPGENGKLMELFHKPKRRDFASGVGRQFNRRHAHEEWSYAGFDHLKPAEFKGRKEGQTIILTKTLADGEFHERRISIEPTPAGTALFRFNPGPSGTVHFRTLLWNKGSQAKDFEVLVHPEYGTETYSSDPDVFSVYLKDKEWKLCNRGWKIDHGAEEKYITEARGGAYAFFNREQKFGILQTYDPKYFAKQELFWSPGRQQVNLEMVTPRTHLEVGQGMEYGYDLSYLAEPPL